MTFKQRSFGVSANVAAVLNAERQRFAWVSGTILGLDVVPDVCSTRAVSDDYREARFNRRGELATSKREEPCLRLDRGNQLDDRNAALARHPPGRRRQVRRHDQGTRIEIGNVKVEFFFRVGGIEGGTRCAGSDREKSHRHFRAVRQDKGYPVVRIQACRSKRLDRLFYVTQQTTITKGLTTRSGDRNPEPFCLPPLDEDDKWCQRPFVSAQHSSLSCSIIFQVGP